jgi:hypothetical protein
VYRRADLKNQRERNERLVDPSLGCHFYLGFVRDWHHAFRSRHTHTLEFHEPYRESHKGGTRFNLRTRRASEQAPNDYVARLNDRARRRASGELI